MIVIETKHDVKRLLELLSRGDSFKLAAYHLGVNEHTVKMLTKRMMDKNGYQNTTHMIAMAIREKFIE